MGQIIRVDFAGTRRVIDDGGYESAIARLEREACKQPPSTARQLRRLAKAYRERADQI